MPSQRDALKHSELLQLTGCPAGSYDWQTFMGDQTARPLVFHGTSTAFRTSIPDIRLLASPSALQPSENTQNRCTCAQVEPRAGRRRRFSDRDAEQRSREGLLVHVRLDA